MVCILLGCKRKLSIVGTSRRAVQSWFLEVAHTSELMALPQDFAWEDLEPELCRTGVVDDDDTQSVVESLFEDGPLLRLFTNIQEHHQPLQ